MAGWIKMQLGTEVGLVQGNIVLDGDSPPPRKGAQQPHTSAHVYCGQKAGWIRIPLGMEVGLGPGDIVLDGEPAPPRKQAQQPFPHHFSAHFALARLPISVTAEVLSVKVQEAYLYSAYYDLLISRRSYMAHVNEGAQFWGDHLYKNAAVAEMGDWGHNRHGPKRGGGLMCPLRGELGPRVIQCGMGTGLIPYQVTS